MQQDAGEKQERGAKQQEKLAPTGVRLGHPEYCRDDRRTNQHAGEKGRDVSITPTVACVCSHLAFLPAALNVWDTDRTVPETPTSL